MKVLIMGLRSAGKTTLVKHVLEGKEWDEIKNLNPTEFVETTGYKYRGLLDVTTFDCGGQESFILSYFTEQWSHKIFSDVSVFIWIIDSSDLKIFSESKKELKKSINFINTYSPGARKFVIATKYDIHKISLQNIRKELSGLGIEEISSTAIPLGIAREIVCTILDGTITKELKSKITKLEKKLNQFNKKVNAIASLIINKSDGLELASSVNSEELDPEILKYISTKTLVEPLKSTRQIFSQLKKGGYVEVEDAELGLWHVGAHYVNIFDINEQFALFSILEKRNIKINTLIKYCNLVKNSVVQFLA
ncbi:MAG: ADP-ribosylation factor-like protein [Promethearchaeota archaeon]